MIVTSTNPTITLQESKKMIFTISIIMLYQCHLVKLGSQPIGEALVESIEHAKEYLTGALEQMLNLGQGSGPVDHGYVLGTMKYLK